METNRKVIGNAISAYFLMFISATFFLNKENKYINNDFVKSHTKTAVLLHILFLLVYIIFIYVGLGRSVQFLGFSLSVILSSSFFIGLFGLLMYGVYHANKGKTFTISDMMSLTKTDTLLSVDEEKELSETEKFSIIISYIPFLGYFHYGKHLGNTRIQNIVKLNLIVSSIIAFFYIIGGANIANLFTLFYIVYVVFCVITLLVKDEVISLDIHKIPVASEEYIWGKTLWSYVVSHLKGSTDSSLSNLYSEKRTAHYAAEKFRHEEQSKHKNIFASPYLIYLPVVNIIFLGFLKSKYKYHIINGITISLFAIALGFTFGIKSIAPLLVLFPISFGLGYINRLGYQMPYVYDFYGFFATIGRTIKKLFSKGRAIQKKEEKVVLEVK